MALRSCGHAGRQQRKAVRQQVATALAFKPFKALVTYLQEQVEDVLPELPHARQEPQEQQQQQQLEDLPRLGGLLTALDAFKHIAGNPKSREHAAELATGMPSLKRHQIQLSAAAALAFNSPQLVRLLMELRPGKGGAGPAYGEALQLMAWGTARLFLFQTPPDCLAPAVLEAAVADMGHLCCLPQVSLLLPAAAHACCALETTCTCVWISWPTAACQPSCVAPYLRSSLHSSSH